MATHSLTKQHSVSSCTFPPTMVGLHRQANTAYINARRTPSLATPTAHTTVRRWFQWSFGCDQYVILRSCGLKCCETRGVAYYHQLAEHSFTHTTHAAPLLRANRSSATHACAFRYQFSPRHLPLQHITAATCPACLPPPTHPPHTPHLPAHCRRTCHLFTHTPHTESDDLGHQVDGRMIVGRIRRLATGAQPPRHDAARRCYYEHCAFNAA